MSKVWDKFCVTLDKKYWDQAQSMWSKLDNDGANFPLL